MYLRRVRFKDGYHYVLRETYREGGYWLDRDLLDLGPRPENYIEYPGGNGFYFNEELEEVLALKGVMYSAEELEEIFLPFLDPHIRRVVESFHGTGFRGKDWRGCPEDELRLHQNELHSFDKRRLHFLRCGRIDIGDLEWRTWKFLNILLCKSRDEIEHILEGMERALRPQEIRSYLYTAFHLQSYFPNHLTRNLPGALDPERVDYFFLEEICHLNQDGFFFKGIHREDESVLHPYLVRYVILYFDNDFEREGLWTRYMEDFMRRRQAYGGAAMLQGTMKVGEACRILGISREEFDCMTRKALVRRFRTEAKKIHPDRGGEHEAFVQLSEAYEVLLARK